MESAKNQDAIPRDRQIDMPSGSQLWEGGLAGMLKHSALRGWGVFGRHVRSGHGLIGLR